MRTRTRSVFVANVVQPYGLGFDSKGNLYGACQSSPSGRIRKVTPQGVVTNFGPTIVAPYGLAIDAGDNIFVSNGYGYIYKITPEGNSSMFRFVNGATGLAFDKVGNLYAADNSVNVTRITPAGVTSTFATGLGSSLVGLAFDNDGNLYAASYTSGVISKIAPDRSVSIFATVPGGPSFLAVYPPPTFDPGIVGIATDIALETRLPTVHLDDIPAVADLLLRSAMGIEEAVASILPLLALI